MRAPVCQLPPDQTAADGDLLKGRARAARSKAQAVPLTSEWARTDRRPNELAATHIHPGRPTGASFRARRTG
jgi:hypothetical protein